MGAAKAALDSLVRYCAVSLAPRRITVNAISPGGVFGPPNTLTLSASENSRFVSLVFALARGQKRVSQVVERIVVLVVAGSSPVGHPASQIPNSKSQIPKIRVAIF